MCEAMNYFVIGTPDFSRRNRTIWKFELSISTEILLPKGSSFLAAQVQKNKPVMWFEVGPNSELESQKFFLVGTGHPIEENLVYLDTFQMAGGDLVLHLYWERK